MPLCGVGVAGGGGLTAQSQELEAVYSEKEPEACSSP